jgi:hypothetical protein
MKLTTKTPTPETDDLARGNHVVPTEWAEQLERERDEARKKIGRQRERIAYLEGATHHACGTPLSKAIKERDEAREALREAIQFRDKTLNGYDLDAWLKAADITK